MWVGAMLSRIFYFPSNRSSIFQRRSCIAGAVLPGYQQSAAFACYLHRSRRGGHTFIFMYIRYTRKKSLLEGTLRADILSTGMNNTKSC